MSVNIHGKEYITVAERVSEYHEDHKTEKGLSITTEVLAHTPNVVVKATVITRSGTFTGISAANPSKPIEKMSPYEVAETSAVGRALGFAGYGAVDSIASADEMVKSGADVSEAFSQPAEGSPDLIPTDLGTCKKCGSPIILSKRTGAPYCSAKCWNK